MPFEMTMPFAFFHNLPEDLAIETMGFTNFADFTRFARVNKTFLIFAHQILHTKELAIAFLLEQPVGTLAAITYFSSLKKSKAIFKNALLSEFSLPAFREKKIIRATGRIDNELGPWALGSYAPLLHDTYQIEPLTPFIQIAMADTPQAHKRNALWLTGCQQYALPFYPPKAFPVDLLLKLGPEDKLRFRYHSYTIELTLMNKISEETKEKIKRRCFNSLVFRENLNQRGLRKIVNDKILPNFYLESLRKPSKIPQSSH